MKLGRIFANALARRLAYIAAALLLAGLGIGTARAHTTCPQDYMVCTKASSRAQCEAHGREHVINAISAPGRQTRNFQCYESNSSGTWRAWRPRIEYSNDNGANWHTYAGNDEFWWNTATEVNECPNRAPLFNLSLKGAGPHCVDGCVFSPNANKNLTLDKGGSNEISFSDRWAPTGNECSAATPQKGDYDPEKGVCQSKPGGYTECVNKDGRHCVTTPRGKRLCWDPGQEGPRTTNDGKDGADRKKAEGGLPTSPPPNMQDPQQQGPTSQTVINGNVYNNSNYSGAGNTGGQGNTGDGGSDGGDGEGEEGEEDGGPGTVGAGVGELDGDEPEGISALVANYSSQIRATPLAGAFASFLTVSGGASCPVWTLGATEYWDAMTFDFHCSGPLANALVLVGYVLLAVAAYTAFKIAFY